MKKNEVGIWKYCKTDNKWILERSCMTSEKDQWLKIYKKDYPSDKFMISSGNPNK